MPDSTALSWVNEAIRRALSPYPEGLVIVTKVGALAELRDAGMIRHLGVSSVRLRLLALAQVQAIAPVVAVQNRYGVDFGRAIDDLLRVCGRQAIAFVPFFALAGTGP
jgi:aryl-alcohol dehydrogenase-like predicted oxidoreductase